MRPARCSQAGRRRCRVFPCHERRRSNHYGRASVVHVNHYMNTDDAVYYSFKAHDDDFYGMDDDGNRRLRRSLYKDVSYLLSAMEAREAR